jgi:RimJ/RimL family protein N-acetyltransferase
MCSNHYHCFPRLNGKTVLLRQLRNTDAKNISILLTQEVATYLKAKIPSPYKINEARNFIRKSYEKFKSKKALIFAIDFKINSDNSLFVGIISIEKIDFVNMNSEVGYWIGKDYWYKGITTESLKLLVGYSFNVLNLHKLYASVFSKNISSIRVLEKCHFRKEGELFEHRYKNEKFQNILLYSIINGNNK